MSIRVHVRRIFRFAYAERNRKDRDHPKADFTRRRGDGSESPLKKRKAESVRAKEIVLITGRLENYGKKK